LICLDYYVYIILTSPEVLPSWATTNIGRRKGILTKV
jgi:hypothetical protein